MSPLLVIVLCYTAIIGLTIVSMIQVENSGEKLPTLHKAAIWLTGITWIATLIAGFWLTGLEIIITWFVFSIALMALIIFAEAFTYSKWQTIILIPISVIFFVTGIIYIW